MNTVKIEIPYGRSQIICEVKKENLKAVLDLPSSSDVDNITEKEIVERALRNPIDSIPLDEIARDKKTAVLITNDHTRAMRSMVTLPILLEEIRRHNPDIDITILIATGLHRPTTEEEMRSMFGDEVVNNEKILVHDAFNESVMVEVGKLPSGATFTVNKALIETDMIVTEGFIEPHFFAGFSGGRKSIMPGSCSYKTVVANHSYKFIKDKNAKGGELNKNPINKDLEEAARMVNTAFTLNVVLDKEKYIEAAFAGDIINSHRVGCDYVMCQSKAEAVLADIVITGNSGYPLDQNIYQTPKAVNTAYACCKESSIIIMCAQCEDGIGGDEFEKIMKMGTPKVIDEFLSKIEPEDTIPEQWCAQIYSRLMMKHKIILVTDILSKETVEELNLIHANTIEQALKMAYVEKGEDASVVVIPDGVRLII